MKSYSVLLVRQGWRFDVAQGQSILIAAQEAGIRITSSCRNGSCRTCYCQAQQGQVRHLIEWPSLSQEEKNEGYILPCVATAESDLQVVTDHAFKISDHKA